MFDVGFSELLLVLVIGLVVFGPERLPRIAGQLGRWIARARRMANQLRYQLEEEISSEELAQLRSLRGTVQAEASRLERTIHPPAAGELSDPDQNAEAVEADTLRPEYGVAPSASSGSAYSTAYAGQDDDLLDEFSESGELPGSTVLGRIDDTAPVTPPSRGLGNDGRGASTDEKVTPVP